MIDPKKSGYLVETKDGKVGLTIHEKGMVNGKIPVYLATEMKPVKGKDGEVEFEMPVGFSDQAILCDPKSLKSIGMID